MMGPGNAQGAFGGTRATYVAMSAVTILVLALWTSIWHSDVSGSIALLGLLSVYLSSTELLLLFTVLAPLSIFVDIFRLTGPRLYNARGFLVFLTIAEMLAKAAGAVFGWSLHRSIVAGEGGGPYQPIHVAAPQGMAGPPASGPAPSSYEAAGAGDPFASYAPPRADVHNGGSTNTYQPFPPSGQPHA